MGNVYACADLHGNWEITNKILKFLQPEDTLYFLGDAIDRGSDGIKVFDAIYNRPNTYFLKGNHEEMMAEAIPFVYADMENYECFYCKYSKYYDNWFCNGGKTTADFFWEMNKEQIFAYKEKIDKMPVKLVYMSSAGHTVILEHAGYSPFAIQCRTHDPVWDRCHFGDKWNEGWGDGDPDNTYLVHGHTPVQYLNYMYGYIDKQPFTKEELIDRNNWLSGEYLLCGKPSIIRYCEGHKFDIDMCTIASGRGVLLNLDTFEEIYFDIDEERKLKKNGKDNS